MRPSCSWEDLPFPAADLKPQASPTDIVVLVDPMQKNAESFRQLVADAAQYKLSSLGVAAQVLAASPTGTAKPLPEALAHGATVALVCSYDVEGQSHQSLLMDCSTFSFDLHVLGTPPALILSQDQTLV